MLDVGGRLPPTTPPGGDLVKHSCPPGILVWRLQWPSVNAVPCRCKPSAHGCPPGGATEESSNTPWGALCSGTPPVKGKIKKEHHLLTHRDRHLGEWLLEFILEAFTL